MEKFIPRQKPCSIVDEDGHVWGQFDTLLESIAEHAFMQSLFTDKDFRVIDTIEWFNHILGERPCWGFGMAEANS